MQKLYSNQLGAALSKGLAPVYLVFGEEPLQKMEALDEIRTAARAHGFSERQSFIVEGQFDWSDCLNEFSSLSLFCERKVIDIDIGINKPTPATLDALKQIAALLHPDLLVIVHASKNATEFAKQAWFKPLADIGVQVQFYPLDDSQFMRWLKERASKMGLKLQTDALQLLQHHAAGNLLGCSTRT